MKRKKALIAGLYTTNPGPFPWALALVHTTEREKNACFCCIKSSDFLVLLPLSSSSLTFSFSLSHSLSLTLYVLFVFDSHPSSFLRFFSQFPKIIPCLIRTRLFIILLLLSVCFLFFKYPFRYRVCFAFGSRFCWDSGFFLYSFLSTHTDHSFIFVPSLLLAFWVFRFFQSESESQFWFKCSASPFSELIQNLQR